MASGRAPVQGSASKSGAVTAAAVVPCRPTQPAMPTASADAEINECLCVSSQPRPSPRTRLKTQRGPRTRAHFLLEKCAHISNKRPRPKLPSAVGSTRALSKKSLTLWSPKRATLAQAQDARHSEVAAAATAHPSSLSLDDPQNGSPLSAGSDAPAQSRSTQTPDQTPAAERRPTNGAPSQAAGRRRGVRAGLWASRRAAPPAARVCHAANKDTRPLATPRVVPVCAQLIPAYE
jgi:hypothetical protein